MKLIYFLNLIKNENICLNLLPMAVESQDLSQAEKNIVVTIQILTVEKNVLNKEWKKMEIPSIFYIKNWLWKFDFGTFCWTAIHQQISFLIFPLSMLILHQESCFLGPTIFEIPNSTTNWHYLCVFVKYFIGDFKKLFTPWFKK